MKRNLMIPFDHSINKYKIPKIKDNIEGLYTENYKVLEKFWKIQINEEIDNIRALKDFLS